MSLWDVLARSGQELVAHAAKRLQFQLPADPVPPHWAAVLEKNVPLARRLSPADRERLLRIARVLLDEVPFEGCDGLAITDEIRVTVAATGALLVHQLPYPRFTKLDRILVYPDTFLPVRASLRNEYDEGDPEATLGEAWRDGIVILSWTAVQRAAESSAERNVVLHELAHILDAEDGIFDGRPLHDDPGQGKVWAATLQREFAVQRDAVEAGAPAALDDYAATNRSEFFAVATESFFCVPDRLRDRLPDLYLQLSRFYRQDPGQARPR
jgi:Mlc titration factor MtfA (ptsG expression regulator)